MWSIIKKTADVCGAIFGLWLIVDIGIAIGRKQKESEYESEQDLDINKMMADELKNAKSRVSRQGDVLTIDLRDFK